RGRGVTIAIARVTVAVANAGPRIAVSIAAASLGTRARAFDAFFLSTRRQREQRRHHQNWYSPHRADLKSASGPRVQPKDRTSQRNHAAALRVHPGGPIWPTWAQVVGAAAMNLGSLT